ncbi:MAG: MCE family protein [Campylobacterales bacterium]|nr:MCE family protein [Campylobacterales bacterium]
MYNRINYTVVGIFVLLFSVGMAWFAFWLAKYGIQDKYDIYRIEIKESVTGLSEDAAVKLRGVNIGRVKQIRINPKNIEVVEILLDIKKGTVIKEDMTAHTQMFGVTGLLTIEIDGGTNSAKTLQPTATYIPTIKTRSSYISKLNEEVEKVSALLDRSKKLLSDKNIENFEKTLENLEKITSRGEEVENKAIDSMKQLDQTLGELKISTKTMSDSFEKSAKDISRVSLKVENSLDRGDYNLRNILEPMTIDLQSLSNQINDLTGELRQSPSDLLFKSRQPVKGPGE